MNRVEAMEWAADYAERNKMFAIPTNSRGYPENGAVSPSADQRAEIIMQLADKVCTDYEGISTDSNLFRKEVKRALNIARNGQKLSRCAEVPSEIVALFDLIETCLGDLLNV